MNFGPLIPQEIDNIVKFLEEKKIPFEIIFNEKEAQKELDFTPNNTLQYSEFRTKTYLAQHFYVEVSDEYLINNPKIENEILKFITKHDFEDTSRQEEDNVIHINDEKKMNQENKKIKWIQKAFAIIFLASMLYSIIQSLRK
jgi:hypothetical protein